MPKQLVYGWLRGGKLSVPVRMLAAQTLKMTSGRFCFTTAGYATLNVDGSTRIFGFIEAGDVAPDVDDKYNCNISLDAVFRIPVDSGTYGFPMQGDTCDIAISNNIQGAQLDASNENTLVVVDGDEDDNDYVDVMMESSVWGTGIGVDA